MSALREELRVVLVVDGYNVFQLDAEELLTAQFSRSIVRFTLSR